MGDADVPLVHDLFGRCADYFVLDTGMPPDEETAVSTLAAVPENHDPALRFGFGVFETPSRLVGLLNGVYGYPDEGSLWLGLLVLDPAVRGRELGAALVEEFIAAARSAGATEVHLAVHDVNTRGRRFWERHDFAWQRTVVRGDAMHHRVHVLVRPLGTQFGNMGTAAKP